MSQEISLEHTIYSVTSDCPQCRTRQPEPALLCIGCNAVLVTGLRRNTVIANQYEYISAVGSGGMGLIVKALDRQTQTEVAVKLLLRNSSASDNLRFKQEARAAAMLTHKHIVHVFDYGLCEDNSPYMVMDYLAGDTLAQLIAKNGALDVHPALQLFDQLADAICYAHDKGVIHRDLKPSNIMLTGRDRNFVKVLDFGIAKVIDPNSTEKSLTRTGQVLGSPLYMSPEQALGKPVDARTDVYSAGCLLFHALTGAPPIEGATSIETLFKHLNETPPTLSRASLGKSFPPELEEIIAKALKKDPGDRFQTFEEFRAALADVAPGKISQPRQTALKRPSVQKQPKFKPVLIAVGAVVLVAGAAACGYWHFSHTASAPANQTVPAKLPDSDLFLPKRAPLEATSTSTTSGAAETTDQPSPSKVAKTTSVNASNAASAKDDDFVNDLDQSSNAINTVRLRLSDRDPNIDLTGPTVSNQTLKALADEVRERHYNLEGVDLSKSNVDDSGMAFLTKIPLLRLRLDGGRIDGDALTEVAKIKSLQELTIMNLKKVTPENWKQLGKLKNLKKLKLALCPDLLADDCKFLMSLTSLSELDLSSDKNLRADDAVQYLSRLHNLSMLNFGWSAISGTGVKKLSVLKSLQALDISGADKLSPDAILALTALPRLFDLNLNRVRFSENPFDALKQFKHLDTLNVANTSLSAEDIRRLLIALQNCQIHKDTPH